MFTLPEIDWIHVYFFVRRVDVCSLKNVSLLFTTIIWNYVLYMKCLCLFPLTEIYSVIYVDGCEESEIWFEIHYWASCRSWGIRTRAVSMPATGMDVCPLVTSFCIKLCLELIRSCIQGRNTLRSMKFVKSWGGSIFKGVYPYRDLV